MHRYSIPLKIGRIYQAVSPALWFLDYPFRLPYAFKKSRSLPAIFILGPPRSGSTLLYQILTTAFHNVHLTNIWNLFFSTPMLGAFLSDRFCRNYQTNYKSVKGFVPGICGEAEGMRFWKYWVGQGLQHNESNLKPSRLKKINKLFSKKYSSTHNVWISGYIGHVFCIDLLRKYWPNAVFIHVYRDLLSNAYSIYKNFPHSWFSLDPGGIQNTSGDRYEEIARQITRIHSIILDYYGRDMLSVSYEKLCENPQKVIRQLVVSAQKKDILLGEKNSISSAFEKSEVSWDSNEQTKMLYQYLKGEIYKYKGHKRKFFNNLIV